MKNPDIPCQLSMSILLDCKIEILDFILELSIDDSSLNDEIYIKSHKNLGMNFSKELIPYVHTDLSETKYVTQDTGALDLRKYASKPNLSNSSFWLRYEYLSFYCIIELTSTTTSSLSDRLFFSLDVKPVQKNVYRTDQFRVDPNRSPGQISRVHGIKAESRKMLRALQRDRVRMFSNCYLNKANLLSIRSR